MIGILVALSLSWLLLFLYNRSGLEQLGLLPRRERIKHFFLGLLIAALCASTYFGLIVLISKSKLSINQEFHSVDLLKSIWWITKSVLFEEFLFRGALLYLVIKIVGQRIALLISAVIFGIYHWFSYNIFGDVFQMMFIFLLTAAAGLAFSYSFIKTKSMYLQTGLHFAWNFIAIVVFSNGTLGKQFLVVSDGQNVGTSLSLVLYFFQVLILPIAVILYLKKKSSLG